MTRLYSRTKKTRLSTSGSWIRTLSIYSILCSRSNRLRDSKLGINCTLCGAVELTQLSLRSKAICYRASGPNTSLLELAGHIREGHALVFGSFTITSSSISRIRILLTIFISSTRQD
jgi:hypothetical protein